MKVPHVSLEMCFCHYICTPINREPQLMMLNLFSVSAIFLWVKAWTLDNYIGAVGLLLIITMKRPICCFFFLNLHFTTSTIMSSWTRPQYIKIYSICAHGLWWKFSAIWKNADVWFLFYVFDYTIAAPIVLVLAIRTCSNYDIVLISC